VSETQPIQAAMLSRGRFALAAAASAVGIAACWWAQTPFGLLAPISALFLYAEGRAVPLLFAVLGIGATGSFVAALSNAGALAPSWVALFAVAVCTGAIVAASKLTARAPGETDAAPGGPASLSLVHPEDREAAAQAAAYAFWTGVPQVLRCRERRPDGAYRWAEFRAEPGYGVSVDIDASVALPDERWSSREEPGETAEAVRAAKVIERLHGKAWAFDAGGRFTYVTPAAQAALGMTVDDLNAKLGGGAFIDGGGAGWMRKVHPDDVGRAADTLRHCLKTGEHWNIEYRMLRATGLYVWHRVSARPTRDGTGRITGWYGTSIDIDVYKKTEAALRESERSLRQLVETVPALIWCTAPDGEPVYFSQQLRDFYGFDVGDKDLAGASRLANVLAAVIHPDDLTDVDKLFAHCLATGEPYALKHRQRRFDGEYRWIETRAAAMRNRFGEIVQWNGVCLDIEDQVRAQDELRRAQETLARASQAASLAELSASIAHEVNQPLAAVVANSHACQRWLDAEPPNIERAQRTVERIIRDANSAADVVSRIRALFKQSTDARTCTALGSVIAEARDLLAEEAARRSIRLDVEVGSDIPRAALDRVQIQQVLVNLMRNGMEAMEAAACSRVLDVRARLAGEAIRIEISDRGPGIEFPDRIFEPFFTTKPRGRGMGLAICRSIIESHGGRLWAERAAPHGATFIFTLPATAKAAP
jgi:PAS domain S-box-containing protein